MEARNYTEPTTSEFISAIFLVLSNNPTVRIKSKDQYNQDIIANVSLFNGTDGRRYLKENHNLYCSSFKIDELAPIYFGDSDKSFCQKADLDSFLSNEFNKSKNNKKRTFLALEDFRANPSFKTAKYFLSLYNIQFYFGRSSSFTYSHVAKIADFNLQHLNPVKTEKNKIRDELRNIHKEIKQKEKELISLQQKYEKIKESLDQCEL